MATLCSIHARIIPRTEGPGRLLCCKRMGYNWVSTHGCTILPFKVYTVQWLLAWSQLWNHHHKQFYNIFLTPKGNSTHISSHSPVSLSHMQPLIYFVFLQSSLFWTFYINGIILHVTFWWLAPSLTIILWLKIIAYIGTLFHFYCEIIFPSMDLPHFIHQFIDIWVVSTL